MLRPSRATPHPAALAAVLVSLAGCAGGSVHRGSQPSWPRTVIDAGSTAEAIDRALHELVASDPELVEALVVSDPASDEPAQSVMFRMERVGYRCVERNGFVLTFARGPFVEVARVDASVALPAAEQALWLAGVPRVLEITTGIYVSVPEWCVERALTQLRAVPEVAPCVYDEVRLRQHRASAAATTASGAGELSPP